MGILHGYLTGLFLKAHSLNAQNILSSVPHAPNGRLLDLGCDDGEWTLRLAAKAGVANTFGIEIVDQRMERARSKGIQVVKADLNGALPFDSDFFDIVHANQVIEHLHDVDTFMAEIHRILKPGGCVIISTENGSSWHNIFAAVMGWQNFSLTNFSRVQSGIGNPMALHRHEDVELSSWTHKIIFNYRGLKEFLQVSRFRNVRLLGSGYYPFPASFGNVDVRHAHFLVAVGNKNSRTG
ncbi:MAG: class I SAM-dependent methyltransferase [Bdellovibrionales bacterium]|nr:class I SAM-dependent methyltransferase [Bdellovibrionales bacterium]